MAELTELAYIELPGSVPAEYVLPPGQLMRFGSSSVQWDGSGASGPFLACLSVLSQDGKLIGRYFPGTQFAAGDTGEVTYSPLAGDGSGLPSLPAGGTVQVELTYKETTSNLTVTSTTPAAPDDFIITDPVDLDGNTVVTVEFYCPVGQIGSPVAGGTLRVQLWEDTTPLGIVAHLGLGPTALELAAGMHGTIRYTPAAGSHYWQARAYTSVSTGYLFAGALNYQPDSTVPAFVRVWTTV